MTRHPHFLGPGFKRFDSLRKHLGTIRAVLVVLFEIRVGGGAFFDVIQVFWCCKQPPAAFTPLQGMPADHCISDGNGSDVFIVFNLDGSRFTKIGACAATDTLSFNRYHKIFTFLFHHFQGTGADDLLAHPNT